jgi:peptidoglycan/xylan/chitin deacetylase (PgdA/CDA1 family)
MTGSGASGGVRRRERGAARRAGALAMALALAATAAAGCVIVLGPTLDAGPPARRAVALTFDDGPLPGTTDVVLDMLRRAGARATFFLIGENARRHPALARRIVEEGHEVGNHTLSHREALSLLGPERIAAEIDGGAEAIEEASGAATRLFRMPNGFTGHWVPPILAARGLVHVTFSFRAHDWFETSPERLARRVLRQAKAGAIVVLHDGEELREEGRRETLLAALPAILDGFRERGLAVVGAAELLGIEWRARGAGPEALRPGAGRAAASEAGALSRATAPAAGREGR